MKKFLMILLSLSMLVGCANAVKEHALDYDKYLFEVTDANGNSDYLLGSFRMATDKIYEVSPELEKAFMNCDELVVEANPMEINLKMTQDQSYALTNPAVKYASLDIVDEFMKNARYKRYDPEVYNAMTINALVYMNYGLEVPFLALGATNINSIDRYIAGKAQDFKKPIREFEGVEQQINMMIETSIIAPNYLLEQGLYPVKLEENANSVRDAYASGDSKVLYKILSAYQSEQFQDEADLMKEKLLTKRNSDFYEKITKYVSDEKKQLMLVGVVQLYGDDGLIHRLESNGYTVKCLKGA